MLADWFDEKPEKALNRAFEFEKTVKKKFIEEPGQMKLLIVVDKLLTGFDAPSASKCASINNMYIYFELGRMT
jgi:type I restriction enzyme R subunit